MSFSADQLAVLQKALAKPMPDMEAPPHMSSQPQHQPASDQPHLAKPLFEPVQPPKKTVPLTPLTAAYMAVAVASAIVSIAKPERTLDGALIASPLLSMALCVHALALPAGMLPQKALALACALCFPAALWVGHPGGMWAVCTALSLFFPASMPRGLLRGAAAVGSAAVVAAGGVLLLIPTPLGAHSRVVWACILATLCIQSVIATGRLRGQRLRVVISDQPAAAPTSCDPSNLRPFWMV